MEAEKQLNTNMRDELHSLEAQLHMAKQANETHQEVITDLLENQAKIQRKDSTLDRPADSITGG